jgi:hypothetical protein
MPDMKLNSSRLILPVLVTSLIAVFGLSCSNAADTPAASDLVTVPVKLPAPTMKGTPEDLPSGPTIEPLLDKAPTLPQVPKGAVNVAAGKAVTASDKPFSGTLSQLTDGQKEAMDDHAVEFKRGSQWVQVDLGAESTIYAIAMWHDHRYIQAFHDVILQISNDPEFKTGVTTVFNNDTDNTSGQGVGTDREYFEQQYGKVVGVKAVKGRYVRGYTRGSHSSALNAWQEIEVYGLPAK